MFNYQRVTAEQLQSQLRRAPQIGPMPKKAKNKKAAAEPEVEIDPDLKDCGTEPGVFAAVHTQWHRWCTSAS